MRPSRFFAASLFCLCLFAAGIAHAAGSVSGVVTDSMNSGGYTYVLLKNDGGEHWVAMPEQKVEKGQQMTVAVDMEVPNFHSKTLNRDFAPIIFSSGVQAAGQKATPASGSFAAAVAKERATGQNPHAGAPANAQALPKESAGSAGAVVPFSDIKVEKATGKGAVTVGEVFANAKKLDGQTVRLRGRVMKVSHAIMGRNWIHLQDGTGDPLQNTHDLVVTSDAAPAVGDVVLVSGKLAADKDFGAGYRYAALIEEAKIDK